MYLNVATDDNITYADVMPKAGRPLFNTAASPSNPGRVGTATAATSREFGNWQAWLSVAFDATSSARSAYVDIDNQRSRFRSSLSSVVRAVSHPQQAMAQRDVSNVTTIRGRDMFGSPGPRLPDASPAAARSLGHVLHTADTHTSSPYGSQPEYISVCFFLPGKSIKVYIFIHVSLNVHT
jgi:hypothetical protein